jgi:hypothetical protein
MNCAPAGGVGRERGSRVGNAANVAVRVGVATVVGVLEGEGVSVLINSAVDVGVRG